MFFKLLQKHLHYRFAFIISSDAVPVKNFHNMSFSVVDLKKILEKLQPKIGR